MNFLIQSKSMNKYPDHLPFHQLVDYVEGRLPLTERAELEAHLVACVTCSAKVVRLEHLIDLMRTDKSEDVPPTVVTRVKRLFRSRSVPEATSSGFRRTFLAVLHFDSMGLTQAFGVRSGKPGSRQLLFSTGVDEIDLRIEPAGQAWTVSGQILGESATGGTVVLKGDLGETQADLNEMSEFVLPSIEAGTYKLILNLENVDVEIEDLRIGS
jgi:hypothetical protein